METLTNCTLTPAVGRVPFSTSAVEENVRTIIKSVRDGMSTTSNTAVDEHLISRRQIQAKQCESISGVQTVHTDNSGGYHGGFFGK